MTTQILPEIQVPQAPEVPADRTELLALMERACGCCGGKTPEEQELGPEWDDKQHLRLLNGAIRTLAKIPNNSEWGALYPAARRILALMNLGGSPGGVFYEAVKQGLYDADYKPEYAGTYAGQIIWYMHFYDAKTRQSFYPGFENARTECEKYFNQSLFTAPETATPEQLRRIGYLLGLALHYLTDVTQPMHAVNFTNLLEYRTFPDVPNPLEWRHKAFEGYADSERFNLNPGDYAVHLLDPSRWGSQGGAGMVLHNVSACSRNYYDYSGLRQIVDSKWPWDGFGSEVDIHIIRCLEHGFYHTAMFLLYFAQRAPRA